MLTFSLKNRQTLLALLGLLLGSISVYWLFLEVNLSLESVQESAVTISMLVSTAPFASFFVAFLTYIAICSVPFPLVSVITLLIGYLFGFTWGLFITSFGSAIGGLLLFLLARRYIGEQIVERLTIRFPLLTSATKSQDFWFATSVRFIPGLPFFVPSLVFSLTQISALKFYLSTQFGLLLTMAVFINAGDSLANLGSVNEIFSVRIIVSMLLLATLPLALKIFRNCRAYL